MEKKKKQQLTSNEKKLVAALRLGKKHAQSAKNLAKLIGVNQRTVTGLVNSLRNKGYLIGSYHYRPYNGYYLISSYDEWQETANSLNSSMKHTQATLNGLAKGFESVFGISLLETLPTRKKVK